MPAPPANPSRTLRREDLITLGRSGRPRDFVPFAAQVLGAREDAGLRFLMAANLAQLGLRTLAGEALRALSDQAAADADVKALAAAIDRLPDDRVPAAARKRTALGNLRALRARGIDLGEAFERWSERLGSSDCYRCVDGNIVRRMRWEGAPAWESFLSDQRAVAARFVGDKLQTTEMFPRPLAIEGLDPPWLFALSWETLKPNRMGYTPPITLLQADPLEFLDGLSALDLREMLIDPRIRVFVGPDASDRWLDDALGRLDEVVFGAVVPLGVTRTRLAPPAQEVMRRAAEAQAAEFERVQERVRAAYAERDASWWSCRYREAASGGRPLRVLVPTSRYSTYIRHAAADLAEAFRAAGCEALVHMEPRADVRPSTVGHARVIDRFEPDLIALINYFRGDAGLTYPENVPWLCWLQDALPHQFAARSWSELDFVAGHVHKEIAASAGFPAERSMSFPVVASSRKFYDGPIDPGLRHRFACEIAYVSHQSETPEAFHERCKREMADAHVCRLVDALRPAVERETATPMERSLVGRIERATRDAITALEGSAEPGKVSYICRHYALPLADRVLRHETLRWGADLCRARGWRMKIFGRGWDKHPTLASLACGEVEHGEELRVCYAAAAVHLHISVNTLVHQRVMECALSGGLPLARLTYDAVSESTGWALREALLNSSRVMRNEEGSVGVAVAGSEALEAIAAQRERLGMPLGDVVWMSAARATSLRRPDCPVGSGLHAAWLYGGLSDGTFRSADELALLVEQATADAEQRRARSAEIAQRVRERCTVDVFARRVLDAIGRSLAAAAHEKGALAA